jgi:hypothetical protein
MDYLTYVRYDAENLQFYLWLRDYMKRFEAEKKRNKSLPPEWPFGVGPSNAPARGSGESIWSLEESAETKSHKSGTGDLPAIMSILAASRDAGEVASLTNAQELNRMQLPH